MISLIGISALTGFVGDAILQYISPRLSPQSDGWGLNPYFKQHGSAEALFVAAGMMAIFYVLYLDILGLKPSFTNLAVYGILLDLFFRETMLFQSLTGYYTALNYFWSGFWGAVPMMLPFLIYKLMMRSF
jgi:hypothetical protein